MKEHETAATRLDKARLVGSLSLSLLIISYLFFS